MENTYVLDEQELAEINAEGWGHCIAGTAGSSILGGLSGAGKTIYLGPYAIAGATVGAIGGGLVGGATFC